MPAKTNRAGSGLHSDVKCYDILQTGGESDSEGPWQNHNREGIPWMLLSGRRPVLPPPMTTKVKGLFKGLKSIFDNNCKEPEMQIGYPTDVKHVAHIGWDGPTVNSPSWMNEFRSTPDGSAPNTGTESNPQGVQSSQSRDMPELPRPTRRSNQASSADTSPTKEVSSKTKHSRRQQHAGDGPRQSRRSQHSGPGSESPQTDTSVSSKGRRKKSKGSLGGGSTRTRQKAASYSDADVRSAGVTIPAKLIEEEEV